MRQIFSLLLFTFPLHAQLPAEMQVDSLIQISRTFTGNQHFTQALQSARAADSIAVGQCGRLSRAYGNACFNHGRVLYFQGVYDEAEPWYLESKEIRAKVLGTADTDYGKSVNNLAILYDNMGQYEKAEQLYLEVLAIREKTPGKESATYADALSNLAGMYMQMGFYEKSERLNLEVMEIREKVLGKNDPAYASSLNNLANLYYALHNYEKAEQLYLESITIRENAGDRESEDYIMGLDNLGTMYQMAERYGQAEPLLLQSKELWEKTARTEHPLYVISLNHLGYLYQKSHDYFKSESFYLQAESVGEKVLGSEHPSLVLNKENLAVLYYEMGQYEKALKLLLECHALMIKIHGKEHPYYSSDTDFLASTYWAFGNLQATQAYLTEAAQTKKKLLLNASRHLSERELEAYIQDFAGGLSRDCSFTTHIPDMAATCYDDVLFYKGFLLNAVSRVRKLASTDPVAAEYYNLFKSYRRRLATEYAKPLAEQKGVNALEAQADRLEKELTRTVTGYGDAMRQYNWKDVQAALPPDAIAIEFVDFKYQHPHQTDSTLYAALILQPGAEMPLFVPLFEEKQLAVFVQTSSVRQSDYVDQLYSASEPGSSTEKSLYNLLWQPVEELLNKTAQGRNPVKTICFSPSGLLHCINLAAVALPDGLILAERYNLVQMSSTRQLAMNALHAKQPGRSMDTVAPALLFGGIRYDIDSTAQVKKSRNEAPAGNSTALRRGAWNYLKGTEKEVDRIANTMVESGLTPVLLKGIAATEEAFKGASQGNASPYILHFATHGFFYPAPETHGKKTKNTGETSVFISSNLPMMRSGLVMAAGNYVWEQGKSFQPDMEDGILTAYEIAQTDLTNTELVVLSACETGLGDIRGEEGVYGLQRAFKIAGARYLIMSLWRVPDGATQELMTAFYRKWLIQKMDIPDAFRAAQKEMRGKYQHPFFWAGFVLLE